MASPISGAPRKLEARARLPSKLPDEMTIKLARSVSIWVQPQGVDSTDPAQLAIDRNTSGGSLDPDLDIHAIVPASRNKTPVKAMLSGLNAARIRLSGIVSKLAIAHMPIQARHEYLGQKRI